MKEKSVLIIALICLGYFSSMAQDSMDQSNASMKNSSKLSHSIGIQINPYSLEFEDVTSRVYKSYIMGLRYFIGKETGLSLGPEVSRFYYYYDFFDEKIDIYNIGLFARYVSDQGVKIVFEAGSFYRFGETQDVTWSARDKVINTKSVGEISWYGSAGFNVNLYKDKLSLDLMAKYNPNLTFGGSHFMPTYKLNFRF